MAQLDWHALSLGAGDADENSWLIQFDLEIGQGKLAGSWDFAHNSGLNLFHLVLGQNKIDICTALGSIRVECLKGGAFL
jgi:hypothetical protein